MEKTENTCSIWLEEPTAWLALKPEIGSWKYLLLNILQANSMVMGETFVFLGKCWHRTDTQKNPIQSSSYEHFAFLPVAKNNIL